MFFEKQHSHLNGGEDYLQNQLWLDKDLPLMPHKHDHLVEHSRQRSLMT